jgi:hypothetical protein
MIYLFVALFVIIGSRFVSHILMMFVLAGGTIRKVDGFSAWACWIGTAFLMLLPFVVVAFARASW